VIAFGTWDISFYLFLKLLLGWPPSLLTWDILFIIPVPWVGPVIAPVLVSTAMIATGIWHFKRETGGTPVRLGVWNWAGILAGAAIIILSFTLDANNVAAGGMPHSFRWPVFGVGMLVGVLGYVSAAARRERREKAVEVRRAEATIG